MGLGIRKLIGEFNEKKVNSRRVETTTSNRSNTLLNDQTSFSVVEAYKTARTNVIFALGATEQGCKKIIVTSASPGEGKTTTTLNLAIAFAQTNAKVLVIDADLRKPRIYRHLSLERHDGLSDVLCDLIDVDTAIKHSEHTGIDCITSGQIPPNPAELLSSDKMGALLDVLSERYDYIFIDTPPVTIVTEAAAMAKFVHGVIVIIRQNYTIHESVQRAKSTLEFANAKILGFILNGVDTGRYGYGGYRKYSYKRGYGYGGYGYGGYGYGYGYGGYGYGYGGYGYGYGERRAEMQDKSVAEANKADSEKNKK